MTPDLNLNTLASVNRLVDAYGRREISDGTVGVYVDMLSDIDPQILAASVNECIARSKWFPTVAEIREVADALSGKGEEYVSAAEAWDAITRDLGLSRPRNEWPPLAGEALHLTCGGWYGLGQTLDNEVKWTRKRFEEIYSDLVERAKAWDTRAPQVTALLPAGRRALESHGLRLIGLGKTMEDSHE